MPVRRVVAGAVMVIMSTAGAVGVPAAAPFADDQLAVALEQLLPAVRHAVRAAAGGRGGPEAVQAQYNAARDLELAIAAARPLTQGCVPLSRAAEGYARAAITEAEGLDRISGPIALRGARAFERWSVRLDALPASCSRGKIVRATREPPELASPRSDEAFFGRVESPAPAGATHYQLLDEGVPRAIHALVDGVAEFTIRGTSRLRLALGVRFLAGRHEFGRAVSRHVWLLPQSGTKRRPATRADAASSARLSALASAFQGYAGIWVQNLATGSYAFWNADARFPAASTVKLAVLIAALATFGPKPERSRVAYELKTLAAWSSNLATNRLLVELGGSEQGGAAVAQNLLTRLGATSSTYTGGYRVGTSRGAAPDQPPLVSQRVTTARDLARILYALHSAATGAREWLRRTGLTEHEARIGLALLLNSAPVADNLGLFRPALGRDFPIAQKQGWLHDARHTAAILYAPDGPRIVVLLTYRPGISRGQAAQLGAQVADVALALH
jgi:beta-lactamase class A